MLQETDKPINDKQEEQSSENTEQSDYRSKNSNSKSHYTSQPISEFDITLDNIENPDADKIDFTQKYKNNSENNNDTNDYFTETEILEILERNSPLSPIAQEFAKAIVNKEFDENELRLLKNIINSTLSKIEREKSENPPKEYTLATHNHHHLTFELRYKGKDVEGNDKLYWYVLRYDGEVFENGKDKMSLSRDTREIRNKILRDFNFDVNELPDVPPLDDEILEDTEDFTQPSELIFS